MIKKSTIFVYQIFYDQISKQSLDSGFIPLDNTSNERPDWFEFWVIRNFLKNHVLEKDAWYGFLSPKFREKTGFRSQVVLDMLEEFDAYADVALFSPAWDQLAYFLNPFEQGEVWHPGLLDLSQYFFNGIGFKVDLKSFVTHSTTSVFGNYIVAKPKFWREWLSLADKFFEFVEECDASQASKFVQTTSYGSKFNQTPMKTFIQERFASVILAQGGFKVAAPDQSQCAPIFTRLFKDDSRTRRMLQACDLLKEKYSRTLEDEYLQMYQKIRKDIVFSMPNK